MQAAGERTAEVESRRLVEQIRQEIVVLNCVTIEMRKADMFKDYPGGRFERFQETDYIWAMRKKKVLRLNNDTFH